MGAMVNAGLSSTRLVTPTSRGRDRARSAIIALRVGLGQDRASLSTICNDSITVPLPPWPSALRARSPFISDHLAFATAQNPSSPATTILLSCSPEHACYTSDTNRRCPTRRPRRR